MARGAFLHDFHQEGRCCRLRELHAYFTSADWTQACCIKVIAAVAQSCAVERTWDTQFGFRPGRGTLDAVFLIFRIVEEASAMEDKRLVLLALDWAKAFDSIAPEALCQ
eukprot:3628640-Pyramimonas_sp.AAC.1